MPFKETSRMEERIRMLLEHESGNWRVSELCRRHGVCRDTFYEWRKRKQSGDPEWFRDGSHAPLQCWQTTDKATAAKVIAARRRFPYMGPRKLLVVLERGAPEIAWPAASTIGTILSLFSRSGAVGGEAAPPPARPAAALHAGEGAQRRMERRLQGLVSHPRPAPDRSADGDGQPQPFPDRAADYRTDNRGRPPSSFERAFREYGLSPLGIRCDNGSPFGSRGAGGLTRLSSGG